MAAKQLALCWEQRMVPFSLALHLKKLTGY
jgi:hypothetical protein